MADNKRTRKYDNLHKNPDYAVVCSFLGKFNSLLNSPGITFENLERWISEQRPICNTFKDFLLSLLKRWRSSANDERFSKYLLKFCESYSLCDAAELEKLGFEKCSMDLKLRLVKNLVEQQFDTNVKFKDKVNMISADELRVQPIGRDIKGKMYWSFMDCDMNLRIFSGETPSTATDFKQKWEIIARNRMELSELISSLQNSDLTIEKLSSNNNNNSNNNGSDSDDDVQKLDAELKINIEGDDIKNDVKEESLKEGDVSVKKEMDCSSIDCDESKAIVSVSTAQVDNGEEEGNSGNQDDEKEISTNYCDANGDKNMMSPPMREEPAVELGKEDENATVSPVHDNQNECNNVDVDDEKLSMKHRISDDNNSHLEVEAAICSYSNAEAKDLEEPPVDGNKTLDDGENKLDETEVKGSVDVARDLSPTESASNEPDADLQTSSLDVVGVIQKEENADHKQDTESLLEEEFSVTEVVKSCEVVKPAVNAPEGSNSSADIERCQSENSFTLGDTKQRDSIAFVEPAAPTTSSKCLRRGFRMSTKRKRDFASSAHSNFLLGRRKGISDSELSESSNDSNPEDSGAQSSAPEDGPPLKRQRNKALINRSRRNILHCRPFKVKDKYAPENSVAIHSSIQVAVPSGDALMNGVQRSGVDDAECQKVNHAEDPKAEQEGIKEENDSKEDSIQGQQVIEEHDSISKISESTKEVEVNIAIPATDHEEDEPTGDKKIRGEPVDVDNPSSPKDRKNVSSDENLNSSIVEPHTMEEKETSQSEISTVETEAVKGAPEFSDGEDLKAEGKISPEMEENVEPVLPTLPNDQVPIGSPANQESSQGNIEGEKMIDVDKKHTHQSPEEEDHEKITDLSVKCATKRPPDGDVKRLEDDGQSVDKDEIPSDPSDHIALKRRCSDFDHLSMTLSQSAETGVKGQKDEPVFPSTDKQMETVQNEGSDESKDSKDPGTALPNNSPISNSSEKGETKVETPGNSQESTEEDKKAEEGRKKSKKVNGCSEEGSADFVELRRSSRVNKGQRKVEMLELEFPSRRRKKKEEMTEEEREKKQAEKERRRTEKMMRQMAEEYEELLQAKKDKKKRFKLVNDDDDDDEDFVPGTRRSLRGKRKKRNDDDDDDDDDEDDDSFSDVDDDGDDGTLGTQSSTSDEELLILESDGSVYEPTGRNARRVASLRSELESERKNQNTLVDQQCLICDKKSEPEFMLLCDKCDDGYHTWCLRPPLHIIPDGDWFCPPCEHKMLLERLQEQLCEFDEKAELNVKLTNRKERLAFVNISLNNILMEKDMEELSEKLQETQSRHLASSSDDDNDDRENDKYSADDDDADFCNVQNGGKKSKVKGKKLLSTDSEESMASCSLKAGDKNGDGEGDDDESRNLIQNKKPKKRNRLTSSSESDSVTDFNDDDEDANDLPDKLPKKKKTKCHKKSDDDDDDDSNDEVSNKKRTKKRRFYTSDEDDDDDGDDDEEEDEVEGNWLVTRRSRRQRKEISYKFEEYENLISGAIEDDVKETYGAGNYGRGKDMANITGAKNNSSNSPAGNGKRRRKKKKFSVLDSDDEGGDNDDDDDDSEEFKIDDASVDEDDEEEDAATEIDQSEIDEDDVESGKSRKGKLADLSSRKSKRNKKRSRAYDDYVIEEDLMLDSKALKRPPARRAAARKGINYNEYTDEENDDESSAKRHKNSEESKRESPSSVKCNPGPRDGKSRKKRSRDEDGDEDYLEDEDDEYEEEDFTPGCRDSYSDDDLRDFIKSGSSTTSECSSSPSRKANKKNKSLTKSQKKKKVASSSSGGGNKRRRKSAGANNSGANKKKGKKTKKKKRKPWYSSDSDEVDEDEASVTRDSYSDDDFVSYTMTAPQKRTGRRALTYKDEQENPAEKPSVSAPVSSADVSVQSSVPLLMKGVTVEACITANQPQAVHSLQPISTVPQVTAATQKIVSPVPQVTLANQRLNSPHPLTTLTGQRITSPHPLQVSAIGQRVASPNFHIAPASMVQTVVTAASVLGSSVPRFAVRDSQAADLSCNVPLPALQAITAQRVSSYNPHIATGGQRLLSQDPFAFSAAAHHFPGASTTTISDPRGMPPLPPLYPIIKNNYLINAPVAMAMRSGMTSFGGICSIAPPTLSQGQKMAEEQVMVNHPFNEKLSSFSVRNITSVAPRNFKPPYGMNLQNAPTEEDFLVQDLDITEFLNPDHANL